MEESGNQLSWLPSVQGVPGIWDFQGQQHQSSQADWNELVPLKERLMMLHKKDKRDPSNPRRNQKEPQKEIKSYFVEEATL